MSEVESPLSRKKMFLICPATTAVYVPHCPFDIEDYYKLNLFYTVQHKEFHFEHCKYLIWFKKTHINKKLLKLFLIHDVDKINNNLYKLFLQHYFQVDNPQKIDLFLSLFEVESINRETIIDLHHLDKKHQIFSTNFQPFVTAIPVKRKIIDISDTEINSKEISKKISKKFRHGFSQNSNVEFKNHYSIILNKSSIRDDENQFIVKKRS